MSGLPTTAELARPGGLDDEDTRWSFADLTGTGDGNDPPVGATWTGHLWMGTVREEHVALEASVAAEIADRASAITAEATSRDNAISAEAAARIAGDAAEAAARDDAISAEAAARIAGDAAEAAARAAAVAAEAAARATALAAHEADTTNVHGIADTATLATATNVADAVAAEAVARNAAIAAAKADLVNGAGPAFDTLAELAVLISSDEDALAALTTLVGTKQAADPDLDQLAGIAATDGLIPQRAGGIWVGHLPADVKATLALVKGDVSLGNVDNVSDANKPVSTAQQAALDTKQPLDSDLTAIAALGTTPFGRSFLDRADALAGRTLLALGNVDNTSDANKPVSTAQAAADAAVAAAAQPVNAGLTTIAGLGDPNADRFIFWDESAGVGGAYAYLAPDAATIEISGTTLRQKDAGTTNAKLADMVSQRLKGRTTAGTGPPEDLTPAQVRTLIGLTRADAFLPPTGVIAETAPRVLATTNGNVLSTGAVSHYPVYLRAGDVVATITFYSGGTGAGTPTNYWYALSDAAYTTIRSTADQLTAAWAASSAKPLALTSSVTIATTGWYNLSIMVKATTPPTLACTAAVLSPPIAQISPPLGLNGSIAQTVPVADGTNLTGANTAKVSVAYATVS